MNALKKSHVLNRQCLRNKIEDLSPLLHRLNWVGPNKDSLFRATWSYYASGCQERMTSIRRRIEQNAKIVAPTGVPKTQMPKNLSRSLTESQLPPGVDLEYHIYRQLVSCFRSPDEDPTNSIPPKRPIPKELKSGHFSTHEQWISWKREEKKVYQALMDSGDPYLKEELTEKLRELNKLISRRPLIVLPTPDEISPPEAATKAKGHIDFIEPSKQPEFTSIPGPYVIRTSRDRIKTSPETKLEAKLRKKAISTDSQNDLKNEQPPLESIVDPELAFIKKEHQPLKWQESSRHSPERDIEDSSLKSVRNSQLDIESILRTSNTKQSGYSSDRDTEASSSKNVRTSQLDTESLPKTSENQPKALLRRRKRGTIRKSYAWDSAKTSEQNIPVKAKKDNRKDLAQMENTKHERRGTDVTSSKNVRSSQVGNESLPKDADSKPHKMERNFPIKNQVKPKWIRKTSNSELKVPEKQHKEVSMTKDHDKRSSISERPRRGSIRISLSKPSSRTSMQYTPFKANRPNLGQSERAKLDFEKYHNNDTILTSERNSQLDYGSYPVSARTSKAIDQVLRNSGLERRRTGSIRKSNTWHLDGISEHYTPFKAIKENKNKLTQMEYTGELASSQPSVQETVLNQPSEVFSRISTVRSDSQLWTPPVSLKRFLKYVKPYGSATQIRVKETEPRGEDQVAVNPKKRYSDGISRDEGKGDKSAHASNSKTFGSELSSFETLRSPPRMVLGDIIPELMKTYGSDIKFIDTCNNLLKPNELDTNFLPGLEDQVKKMNIKNAKRAKTKEDGAKEKETKEEAEGKVTGLKMPSKRERDPCSVCNLVRRKQSELRPYMQRMQKQRQRLELKTYYTLKILKKRRCQQQDTPASRGDSARQVLTRCYQALSLCQRLLEQKGLQKALKCQP